MSSLSKMLGRAGDKKSVINSINKGVMSIQKQRWSERKALILLEKLKALIQGKAADAEVNEAYNNLVFCFEASKRKSDNLIHVSGLLMSCPREVYYKIVDAPYEHVSDFDPRTYMIFDVGTWFHRYIQRSLRLTLGENFVDEIHFYNTELRLTSHVDGGIRFEDGTYYVLEIKSMNNFAYSRAVNSGTASDGHKYQAIIYVKEIDADGVIFLYINKDTCEMVEFAYTRSELKEFEDDAYRKILLINDAADEEQPPKRMCKSEDDKRALSCPYRSHCFNLH